MPVPATTGSLLVTAQTLLTVAMEPTEFSVQTVTMSSTVATATIESKPMRATTPSTAA